MVHRLERCARLDVDDAARGDVLALRWVVEVHRQRARQDDERLLLNLVLVAAPLGAGLVAPDVRAGVGEAGWLAQLGDMARRLLRFVGARLPLEVAWVWAKPAGSLSSATWLLRFVGASLPLEVVGVDQAKTRGATLVLVGEPLAEREPCGQR